MKCSEILIYLDDIIIFSETFEEHLQRLQKVFRRLREAGLTLKPSKCSFIQEEIKILGNIVNKHGIPPDDSKLLAIKNFQSFVGLCSYYRKHIRNFANIAKPLHEATIKEKGFCWDQQQEKAFQELNAKLLSAPVLQHFNPNKYCELRTDASFDGLGAIMLQEGSDGHLHPVAYISRALTISERITPFQKSKCCVLFGACVI